MTDNLPLGSDPRNSSRPASSSVPEPTIAYPNLLASTLTHSSASLLSFETRRRDQKSLRATNAPPSADSPSSAVGASPAPGIERSDMTSVSSKKLPNKKEQRKQADANASQAQQHAATNSTVNMQLGLKNAPSWMRKPASSAALGGFGRQRGSAVAPPKTEARPGRSVWGEYQDSGGVQLIDLALVLEDSAKELNTLSRLYAGMKMRERRD